VRKETILTLRRIKREKQRECKEGVTSVIITGERTGNLFFKCPNLSPFWKTYTKTNAERWEKKKVGCGSVDCWEYTARDFFDRLDRICCMERSNMTKF
jgi:antirestriction protein